MNILKPILITTAILVDPIAIIPAILIDED